jgi:hypothetical protein
MSKKVKILISILTVIVVASAVLIPTVAVPAVRRYRESDEYLYNIRRFYDDYNKIENAYIRAGVHDYIPEGQSSYFNNYLSMFRKITEEGVYFGVELEFHPMKLDANIVNAINDCVDIVGTKAVLNRREIKFTDTSLRFGILDSHLDLRHGKRLKVTLDVSDTGFTDMWIYGYPNLGGKYGIIIGFKSSVTALDGETYDYQVEIFWLEKEN